MIIYTFMIAIEVALSLSLSERNELSRRFKYYFSSVRPSSPDNFISDQNGSFFRLPIDVHLLSATKKMHAVGVEAVVMVTWHDERLMLREMIEKVELPAAEFVPWQPRMSTSPEAQTVSVFLAPTTGYITVYYKLKSDISCDTEAWKYPFHRYTCKISIENTGDEIVMLNLLKDMRTADVEDIEAIIDEFPQCSILLCYPSDWSSSILSSFLPSILVIAVVFFAQWKRRKLQILVSLAALISQLVMLTGAREWPTATLMDLWLSSAFVHTVFLLLVDLTLPARRLRFSLLVHVEQPERVPVQVVSRMVNKRSKVLEALDRLAEKTVGRWRERPASTEIITTTCPAEMLNIHHKIITPNSTCSQLPPNEQLRTASLGERKKIALIVIATSYVIFMIVYALIAMSV